MNEEIWAKSCHISPSMITLDMCNHGTAMPDGRGSWTGDDSCRYT